MSAPRAFRYDAVDADGRPRAGTLEAASPREARDRLRADGLLPVSVEPIDARARASAAERLQRLPAAEVALLTRQLATLLAAGTPLERALEAVAQQSERAAGATVLRRVREEVLAGLALAPALARFPGVFPPLYRALADVGAETGRLADVLARLADYLEARLAMRQKVTLALAYPTLVLLIAMAVIAALLLYVVPQVVAVFEQTRQALPWLTRALIAVSRYAREAGWAWVVALAVLLAGAALLLRRPAVRERWHATLMRAPGAGKVLRGLDTARFASTLAILAASGAPLLRALEAASAVVWALPMRRAATEAAALVREGVSLSRALEARGVFPPLLVHLVASGESSGRLPEMLERAARQQELEAERRLTLLAGLLEPVLIVALGAVVLVLVLAVMLPVISMNQLVR